MVTAGDVSQGIAQRFSVWDKSKFWDEDRWRKHLIKGRGRSKWNIIPQKIINSPAYFDLSFSGKAALVAAFNIVSREKIEVIGKRNRRPEYRFKPFMLPLSMLRATGFKTDTTAVKAIKEIIKHGFIIILKERRGTPTVYEMSEEYLNYKK